jgi:arginyl-tRNA synthetase
MLVRKSDGGFNYATTDMAAIRHRSQLAAEDGGEKANRVLYVTDSGQSQHFQMVFAAARLAEFVPEGVSLEHVPFGLVQGEDGKKFATRSGDTVKLKDLLNESVRIAGEDLKSRNDKDDSERIDRVAEIVGIGAVKYADLSMNRESNYRFSYERMLSLNGNTAPYMLYAYARICGIIRKGSGQEDAESIQWPETTEIIISDDAELELIRNLVRLPDMLSEVERDLYPNKICDYLFETSQKFNKVSELTRSHCLHDYGGHQLTFCFCNSLYFIPVLRELLGEQCRNARTQSQSPFTLFGYGWYTPIMYDLVGSQNCRKAIIEVDKATIVSFLCSRRILSVKFIGTTTM